MLGLFRFELDGENVLHIELAYVKASDMKRILDLLVELGAATEEDIIDTSVFNVNGEKYTFVKCDDDGRPVLETPENEKSKPSILIPKPEQRPPLPLGKPQRKTTDRTMQQKILEALKKAPMTIKELTKEIYGEEKKSGTSQYQHVYDRLKFRLMLDGKVTRERTPEQFNIYVYKLAQPQEPKDSGRRYEAQPLEGEEPESENGIDFSKLCAVIHRHLNMESEEERIITYEALEEARICENATDLWAQLATNNSPLRQRINERFKKNIRFFEMVQGDDRYFIVEVG